MHITKVYITFPISLTNCILGVSYLRNTMYLKIVLKYTVYNCLIQLIKTILYSVISAHEAYCNICSLQAYCNICSLQAYCNICSLQAYCNICSLQHTK